MNEQSSQGMSTLEILVAFSVGILVITAVILVSFGSRSMILQAELSLIALAKAKSGLEIFLLEDFYSLQNTLVADGIFEKTITVEPITNFAKSVESAVSWDGGKHQVVLSRIATNSENALGTDTCDMFLTDDWSNPSEIASISSLTDITQIDVLNNKIYVTTNSSTPLQPDFHIVDISNHSDIQIVSSITTGPGLNALHVAGDYAYVANGSINAQLQIIDVSDSSNPLLKKELKLPSIVGINDNRTSSSIFYSNKKVFLGTNNSPSYPEFSVIDVSDPLSPSLLGSFEIGNVVNDIYVVGAKAYLATASSKQMRILDVNDPSDIKEIGSITLTQFLTQSGKSLYPLGDTVYLGRTYGGTIASNHELHIIDTKSESSVGSEKIGKSVNDIFVRSDKAFLATLVGAEEFQIWNVKDPSNIVKIGDINLNGDGISLDCEGNTMYVATPNKIIFVKGN
ncbi:MAG: hypothetical protein ABI430_01030 [Candidatus Taylorbacteria bacterium]